MSLDDEMTHKMRDEVEKFEKELIEWLLKRHPTTSMIAFTTVMTALHKLIGTHNADTQKFIAEIGVKRGEMLYEGIQEILGPVVAKVKGEK